MTVIGFGVFYGTMWWGKIGETAEKPQKRLQKWPKGLRDPNPQGHNVLEPHLSEEGTTRCWYRE